MYGGVRPAPALGKNGMPPPTSIRDVAFPGLDRTSGASIAREIRWWRWFYRRLSSSSVTRVVIEVRAEPASTWAVIVTTASRGGETMQNWP